jgi:hypothetical protein
MEERNPPRPERAVLHGVLPAPEPLCLALFVAPYAEYRDNVIDLYERYDAGNPFATYDIQRTTLGMDIGIQMAEYGEFRFGYAWGRSKSALDTGFQALPEEENDEGAYR